MTSGLLGMNVLSILMARRGH
ncbi:MAG: hypothetical protein ACFFAY_14945 [Promethearchaeota archaeon]